MSDNTCVTFHPMGNWPLICSGCGEHFDTHAQPPLEVARQPRVLRSAYERLLFACLRREGLTLSADDVRELAHTVQAKEDGRGS